MAPRKRLQPFVVKITPDQRKILQDRANQFTNGNVSELLRQAGLEFEPPAERKFTLPPKPMTGKR